MTQKALTFSRKVDECEPLDIGDHDDRTALHLAASNGHLKAGAYTRPLLILPLSRSWSLKPHQLTSQLNLRRFLSMEATSYHQSNKKCSRQAGKWTDVAQK